MRKVFQFPVAVPVCDLVELYNTTEFFIDTMKAAGARSVELLEEELRADKKRWKAKVSEAFKLPEFLPISDRVTIINESTFFSNERRLEWHMMPSLGQKVPSLGQHLLQFSGAIQIREHGLNACLVYDVSFDIKIPFVGKKAESVGLQVIGKACADQARFAEKRAKSFRPVAEGRDSHEFGKDQ